jgi:hypothetical protein
MADRLMRADPAAGDAPPPKIDTTVAHIARGYDYWLGGAEEWANPGVLWAGVAQKP